jgi:CBS domain containing-hemolysin-like protein
MKQSGYSVVPVYISGTIVGVINRKMVVDGIGKFIDQNKDIDDAINEPVSECLDIFNETNHYEVAPRSITVENLLYMFQQNRKLSSVILTENGNYTEPAEDIIVSADLIDLNNVLDNY